MKKTASRSDTYLANKNTIPHVSPTVANSVSQFRKEEIVGQIERGEFSESTVKQAIQTNGMTRYGLVASNSGRSKFAQVLTNSGSYQGNGDTIRQGPDMYSPLWLNSNMNMPRDRATINAWLRSFYTLNPFVHNAINLHSTYPISKLNIKCPNKKAERFFADMIEEIDLMNICVDVAKEFWLLGESFVSANFNETTGSWDRLVIQNPDYIDVKLTAVGSEPMISIRVDQNLKRIVFSNSPADVEQRKLLPQYIIDAVKKGQNIPLDNYSTSHLSRKISPYEARGTGLPVSIFRQLILFDKLRESKYAQADNMINPLTLVKIGGEGNDAFHPTSADIDSFREAFLEAQYDKDFKLFTHAGVTVEKIGSGAGIYDISGDITQLQKEIYVGLQVPSALMDGGADTTYANAGVALDTLRQRYMQFRNMMSHWLRKKIFAPIAEAQEFYEYHEGEKRLIIPDIDWNYMSLFDAGDYTTQLVQLTEPGEKRRVSNSTLYRSLGLEFEDEVRKMKKENIQAAIEAKEKESLAAMDLNALRALSEEDEIPELQKDEQSGAEEPLPGQDSGGPPSPPPGLDLGGPPAA